MQLKNNRGQGVLMTVLMLGVVMAIIIMFGAKRQSDVAVLINRLDASQTAYEVLAAASKRVQTIYANESSCDPGKLNLRISRLEKLPAAVTSLGFGNSANLSYAVAQTAVPPASALSALERSNICTPNSGTTGCRQLAINLENLVYVVTVGNLVATSVSPFPTTDCPQDVLVRLSVSINNNVFSQWVTLVNVCTLTSCTGDSFSNVTVAIPAGSLTTTACPYLASRYYGNITSAAGASVINSDDLRWARRYLETGGGSVGETTNMNVLVSDTTNSTCVVVAAGTLDSSSQCFGRNCVPAFDLNRDKTNSEADLAILELYLRGYLLSLPASYLN